MILITQKFHLPKAIVLTNLISRNGVYILFQENKLNLSFWYPVNSLYLFKSYFHNTIPSATVEKYLIKAAGY